MSGNNLRRRRLTVLCFIFCFFNFATGAQEFEWRYPWTNLLNTGQEVPLKERIPILLDGFNYRVLEIKSKKPTALSSVSLIHSENEVDIFYLPVISGYQGNELLDVLIPIKEIERVKDTSHHFLFKFKGVKPGVEDIGIQISMDGRKINMNKEVIVSPNIDVEKLSLNVWAYFEYDFITKGVKEQVIDDLVLHKANLLIIPPFHFPKVSKKILDEDIEKLKRYLNGTTDNFDYFVFFMGYTEANNPVLRSRWKNDFLVWNKEMNLILKDLGIPKDKILLYPFDEPQGKAIEAAGKLYDWSKKNGIPNPFYVTIGGRDRKKSIELVRKFEFVQVANRLISDAVKIKGPDTKLFSYAVIGQSRRTSPSRYTALGIEAYSEGLDGIGVWHYSDMKRAVDETFFNSFYNGRGTWEIEIIEHVKDYSLVYRKHKTIYSSLRWEALAFGIEEFQFLKLYERIYGAASAKSVSNRLLLNELSRGEWEILKVKLLLEMEK